MKFRISPVICLLLITNAACAGGLSVSYAPAATVKGNVDKEAFSPDNYHEYDLDPGTAISLGIHFGDDNQWYTEYTRVDTEHPDGSISKREYSSLVFGLRSDLKRPTNDFYTVYMGVGAGAGVARFNLNNEKYRALAEIKIDMGLLIGQSVTVGPGLKFQVIGDPGELMATTTIFYIETGVRF